MSNPTYNILIVEDEALLRSALTRIFTHFGHTVREAGDSTAMDAELAAFSPDIILLDINLPGEDGVRITRRLRETSSCGIIMMTGRGKMDEKLEGYQCGADIYFVKPIDPLELHAAILSLGRRLKPAEPHCWRYLPAKSELITPHGISVPLTGQQEIILSLLTSEIGRHVPRIELLTALGHPDDEYACQRLETLLSRFRARVKTADPDVELPIRARHKMTYAFLAEIMVN